MTVIKLLRRHGVTTYPDPRLHAVKPDAPVETLTDGRRVLFSLCGIATEVAPPVSRGWPRCQACHLLELELHKAALPDKKDPTVFIHEPGLTAVEQILGQALTPEHREQVNELARAFLAGDMSGFDEAMDGLCAMTEPDTANVFGATMLFVQARDADRNGDHETARLYWGLSTVRYADRIQTMARIIGLLTIGLAEGELPDYEHDQLVNGLLDWVGWCADAGEPMVDKATATAWLTSIRRINVPPAN